MGNDKYWWVTAGAVSIAMDVNFQWSTFTPVDEERTEHCMVQTDCNTVAIIGGAVGGATKNTILLYNVGEASWSTGPE